MQVEDLTRRFLSEDTSSMELNLFLVFLNGLPSDSGTLHPEQNANLARIKSNLKPTRKALSGLLPLSGVSRHPTSRTDENEISPQPFSGTPNFQSEGILLRILSIVLL